MTDVLFLQTDILCFEPKQLKNSNNQCLEMRGKTSANMNVE